MMLITKALRAKLIKNWPLQGEKLIPAIKIFSPVGGATWLICSMDPEEPDLLFGLCDPDLGFPEVGYTSLTALQNMKVPVRFRIGPRVLEHHMQLERDLHFKATHSLSVYAQAARHNRGITENSQHLEAAARMLDREHAKRT